MNTKINYMYKDANNSTLDHSEIVSGVISDADLADIMASLDEFDGRKGFFFPIQVGLPFITFSNSPTEADHPWHTLAKDDFECVDNEPTLAMSAAELAEKFRAMTGKWGTYTPVAYDPNICPYCGKTVQYEEGVRSAPTVLRAPWTCTHCSHAGVAVFHDAAAEGPEFMKHVKLTPPTGMQVDGVETKANSHKRVIIVAPTRFAPEFEMTVNVPDDRDDEEYIDVLLDSILNSELRYNCEWEFKA